MTYLQRTLLSSDIQKLSPEGWRNCFEQVLFPLLTELLKPFSGGENNSIGIEETRLRASVLLSKIFLQYLPKLTELTDFHKLWLQILHFIEIYMKADHSDLLAEAIPEALKNILLVMTATGILQPGVKTTSGEDIWQLSWTAIDAFCPSLREELQPPKPATSISTPVISTTPSPSSSATSQSSTPPLHAQSTPAVVTSGSRSAPPSPSTNAASPSSSSSPSTPISYSPSSSAATLPSVSPSSPTASLSSSGIIERDFVVVEADGPITFI
jgi:brefeldin A-resistance guanine nucleotide exchange factor 1